GFVAAGTEATAEARPTSVRASPMIPHSLRRVLGSNSLDPNGLVLADPWNLWKDIGSTAASLARLSTDGREALPVHPRADAGSAAGAGSALAPGRTPPGARLPDNAEAQSRPLESRLPHLLRGTRVHSLGHGGDGIGDRQPLLPG